MKGVEHHYRVFCKSQNSPHIKRITENANFLTLHFYTSLLYGVTIAFFLNKFLSYYNFCGLVVLPLFLARRVVVIKANVMVQL